MALRDQQAGADVSRDIGSSSGYLREGRRRPLGPLVPSPAGRVAPSRQIPDENARPRQACLVDSTAAMTAHKGWQSTSVGFQRLVEATRLHLLHIYAVDTMPCRRVPICKQATLVSTTIAFVELRSGKVNQMHATKSRFGARRASRTNVPGWKIPINVVAVTSEVEYAGPLASKLCWRNL